MRSKDPAVGFVILVILVIVYYRKIEEFLERIMPSKMSDLVIKIISHVIVVLVIGVLAFLYYKAAKNPSLGVIAGAIAGGLIVRFILNEFSRMMFNEKYD